ncbi:MAG: hypothetical protein U1E97_03040 [Alphaproteobacteria bacterium]
MKRLAWPPRGLVLDPADKIYLRPCGLHRPQGGSGDGAVLPLAGGPLAFDAVELVIRRAGPVRWRTAAPLAAFRSWSMPGEGEVAARRMADILDRPRGHDRLSRGLGPMRPPSWGSST